MEKKTNVDFVAKERLDLISEAFKKEDSVSSSSILDELERLHIEVKGENCNILPGMLVYNTPIQTFSLFSTHKEGCYLLSNVEIQELEEQIEQFLQRKDECKSLLLEDLDE